MGAISRYADGSFIMCICLYLSDLTIIQANWFDLSF